MNSRFENIVIVTRRTELEELILRFNTKAQAAFYLKQAGHSIDAVEAIHDQHHAALAAVREALPHGVKHQTIERERLPTFMFGDDDLVITVGQDGLVSNTAKYLDGPPIFAINPDATRYDGILMPFERSTFQGPLRAALKGQHRHKIVRLAEATSSANQSLLAFNDFFVGARSHVSARYEICIGKQRERQSSSGVIVSTGAGSTGWLQSIYAGAAGVIEAFGGTVIPPPNGGRLPWDSEQLVYSVREPFPSGATGTSMVHGLVDNTAPLQLVSHMGSDGVVFSDGVESDYLAFNAGTTVQIGIAKQVARLISD